MAAATVLSVLQLVLLAVNSQPVSMNISLEQTAFNFLYIHFPNNTFEQFYECLTQKYVQACHLKASQVPSIYHNGTDKTVNSVTTLTSQLGHFKNTIFNCSHYQNNNTVICQRIYECENKEVQSFNLPPKTCNTPCVAMCWKFTQEKLIYSTTRKRLQNCSAPCTSQGTTVGDTIDDNTRAQANNYVPVIVGVVCGVSVIVIAVVIVILFWRRQHFGIPNCNGSPKRKLHSGYANEYVQGSLQQTRHDSSSNQLDFPSNFNGNRIVVKQDNDLSDGYYKLDYDLTGNKHQTPPGRSQELTNNHVSNSNGMTLATVNHDLNNDYSCIEDFTADNGTNPYTKNVNAPSGTDVYTLATCVNSLEENSNTEPKTVYSKLGENVIVMMNPYDK